MTKQTITAVFDTRDHAEAAGLSLRQAGIPATDINLSPEDARDELGGGYSTATTPKPTGFMASLENMFGGYDDRETYAEGVRRGGTLLTAHVDDAYIDRAVSLLEQHGAVDLDEREETWRGEGWTSGQTSRARMVTDVAGTSASGLAATGTTPATTVTTTETRTETPVRAAEASVTPTRTAASGTDDVIQVVEERLNVGKRAVSRGKVRLHSYVVENQVSENVTLRDETVTIDRRAVDRPVAELGADAFQERTIEMEEVDEEAVVGKTARVVEEIGIRKDATDRVETVRDTVRSTKVDIEDGRTTTGAATQRGISEGSNAGRIVEHMEVYASDGTKVGTVDHMDGPDRIKLAKSTSPDGQHHLVPMTWVDHVDQHVHLNKTVSEMKASRQA